MNKISEHIAQIRQDYRMATLDEDNAGDDPFLLFKKWFKEAELAAITEVNAMTLCTVDEHHFPHARIVLLKGLAENGFVFYTNYLSNKGIQISKNPNGALVFFWKELERQVRIEGMISKVSDQQSDQYFYSRPIGSQIGAIASPQSSVIADKSELIQQVQNLETQYKDQKQAKRPIHWGGYLVQPQNIEFWQGGSSRLHDRILFKKENNHWNKFRLAP